MMAPEAASSLAVLNEELRALLTIGSCPAATAARDHMRVFGEKATQLELNLPALAHDLLVVERDGSPHHAYRSRH